MPKFEGEKLNDANWHTFSFGFLAFAKTRDTDGIYRGTDIAPTMGPNSRPAKAWASCSALAALDLIQSVDKDQYKHLRGIDNDAHTMWAKLELFHTSGDSSHDNLGLWNTFFAARYTDFSIPLKTHIGCILEIVEQLTNVFSDPPSNSQTIARILSSLPYPEFDEAVRFVTNHSSVDDAAWVIAHLLKEEAILRRAGRLSSSGSESTAFATSVIPIHCSNCHGVPRVENWGPPCHAEHTSGLNLDQKDSNVNKRGIEIWVCFKVRDKIKIDPKSELTR
ncbi:hypothetical protein B0H13DRAFT_1887286 [Mycena leptocephala]|nr:hypothetical protein B0H13DRAFT_1887286 [Mycena leptocephala]